MQLSGFVTPEEFGRLDGIARELGFAQVASGAVVRINTNRPSCV